MKIVDANVLIYAVDADAPRHEAARSWIEDALSGHDDVVMPWLCLLAFIRIMTHPALHTAPLTTEQALDVVDAWLSTPVARADIPRRDVRTALRRHLAEAGVGGNLVNDAYLAALASSSAATLVTFDRDFTRFKSVDVHLL